MSWFVLATLTAFFESLKDVFSKRSLKTLDEYIVACSLMFFALPFLVPLLFFIEIPSLGEHFWMALFIGGTLNVTTTILYLKAIKDSDLSKTVPLVASTPLFLLITSPLIVGEFPTLSEGVGILLIVTGAYMLNLKQRHRGYLAPLQALLSERGPRLMLTVAFIWSLTSNFDKVGVKNSSPIFWAIAMYTFITLGLLPIMLYKSRKNLRQILPSLKVLIPIGLFNALVVIFQMKAISLTLVAQVIAVKRTSTLMSVLFGYLLFKEKAIKERLTGAFIMILGVCFISLF